MLFFWPTCWSTSRRADRTSICGSTDTISVQIGAWPNMLHKFTEKVPKINGLKQLKIGEVTVSCRVAKASRRLQVERK